jgi:hypothetical protein
MFQKGLPSHLALERWEDFKALVSTGVETMQRYLDEPTPAALSALRAAHYAPRPSRSELYPFPIIRHQLACRRHPGGGFMTRFCQNHAPFKLDEVGGFNVAHPRGSAGFRSIAKKIQYILEAHLSVPQADKAVQALLDEAE